MRVYLVIVDETDEAHVALRFAARRAAKTGGVVHLLALVPKQAFNAFGGVQATIEGGRMPQISVRVGEGKSVISQYLKEHKEVAALVLGAAHDGGPGPLVSHFTANAGSMQCPLFVVPGGLTDEEIDRLS
jgi:hypothetical protein